MKRKIVFAILCSLFIFSVLQVSSSEPGVLDVNNPKSNTYSKKRENYLLSRGYKKEAYNDFSSTAIFKIAYRDIYNEQYTDILPTYIGYYKMKDNLYYCMLSDRDRKEDPPIMTFLILEKENEEEKMIFYKINYTLSYELVEKKIYDSEHNRYEKQLVKVFY